MAGTRIYMGAEALVGAANEASDVFALGTIWYKMLTGKYPFDDAVSENGKEDDAARLWRIKLRKTVRPLPPCAINKTCPEATSEIILRCLEHDLSKRFRDADQLLKVLQKKKLTSDEYLRESEIHFKKALFPEAFRLSVEGIKSTPKGKTDFFLRFIKTAALIKLKTNDNEVRLALDELKGEDAKWRWINRGDARKYLWETALEFYKRINDPIHVQALETRLKAL